MQPPEVKIRFAASALTAAMALVNSPLSFAADSQPVTRAAVADPETVKLGLVTVSATRREESIQDVPTPITTLSGSTLEEQRVYRIQDIQQYLPSTNFNYSNPRQSSLSIRGIGNNPASDGLEGSTGVYLDNVYLGRPGMAVFDMLDIEQIDLLRGPQGTLFGKNTTAGVLNITTRRPTFTPERSVETSVGNHGYVQTKGVLSGPLNDQLAGRLSLYRTRQDGTIDNVYNGDELAGSERKGVRGQLFWNVNEDVDVRVIADYNEERSSSGNYSLYSVGPTINGVNRFLRRASAAGAQLVKSPRKVAFDGDNNKTIFQGGLSTEINWNMPEDFKLTSVTAYRWWDFTPHNDDFLTIDSLRAVGTAVDHEQWSQEIRLASPKAEDFDYVVGAYYYGSYLKNNGINAYGNDADVFNNTATGALSNVTSRTNGHLSTNSYALFGQMTFHLTQATDLNAGVRGTYESKQARIRRDVPIGPAVSGAALTARNNQVGQFDSGALSQYSFSPSLLLSLNHHFTDNLMGYASYSHGEKSGGINVAVGTAARSGPDSLLIGSERANNFELGLKSTLFDDSLRLSANLFWNTIHSYQANAYDPSTRSTYLTNAGSVRSRGAEVEANWQPIRGLSINTNISYNDVRYTAYENGPCAPEISFRTGAVSCDLTGATVPGASKWIANTNARYQWALANGLRPYVSGSYSFRTHAPGTIDNSRYSEIASYGLANFALGVSQQLGDGDLDLSIWTRNAFNKVYYTNVSAYQAGAYMATVGDPRMVGVTARYDF